MADPANPLRRCVAAFRAEVGEKEGTLQGLADLWEVSATALYGFERQGYLPLARAKMASTRWALPLRDLVKPDIRAAMDLQAASSTDLLAD